MVKLAPWKGPIELVEFYCPMALMKQGTTIDTTLIVVAISPSN
jgi:hypothetical protein